jgi:hypothetical protein
LFHSIAFHMALSIARTPVTRCRETELLNYGAHALRDRVIALTRVIFSADRTALLYASLGAVAAATEHAPFLTFPEGGPSRRPGEEAALQGLTGHRPTAEAV